MTRPRLGNLTKLEPRQVWESEPRDFTPWLRDNIGLLGKELGVDLEVTGIEVAVGEFAVDIHGRDITNGGRPFIVENQLEATDHLHLGQLMTYAGGLDAATVIWVTPHFRDEHRRALDWLNEKTADDVDFFGVEVELLQIDDSTPAPHFRIVAQPNAWAKRTKKRVSEGITSERSLVQIEFLTRVIEAAKVRQPGLTNASRPGSPNSVWFAAGRRGFYLSWALAHGNIRVELSIQTGDREASLWYFDQLYGQEPEIRSALALPIPLEWIRNDTQDTQRIVADGPPHLTIDGSDAELQQMEAWAVDTMLRVAAVVRPRIRALPDFIPPLASAGEPA